METSERAGITAIKLESQRDEMVVFIETTMLPGILVEVIREKAGGPISHFIERSGLERVIADAIKAKRNT